MLKIAKIVIITYIDLCVLSPGNQVNLLGPPHQWLGHLKFEQLHAPPLLLIDAEMSFFPLKCSCESHHLSLLAM
jgi:hypothetical protein